MPYDETNIFAKILRGEIPCNKVAESPTALAFHDIHPKASVHILVIPKGPYTDFVAFHEQAPEKTIVDFYQLVNQVVEQAGLRDGGFKLVTRSGVDGGQEVPHFHVHILGGQKLD